MRPNVQAELDQTFAALALLKRAVERHFGAPAQITHLARDGTDLAIWPSNQRPRWWGDHVLRKVLTDSHRQMTLNQCRTLVAQQFGRTVSRSSLQRYWSLLDQAKAQRASVLKSEKEAA